MELKDTLFALTEADFLGGSGDAKNVIKDLASKFAPTEELKDGGIVATLKGKTDYTLLYEAHYDQIGFVVTEILEGGFVHVGNAGGIDPRILPATRVKIYGKEVVKGVFTSVPPHLKGDDGAAPELSSLSVDTGLTDNIFDIISLGDRVVFDAPPCMLGNDTVTAASLDDRAGCAALLYALQNLSGKELPVTVKFLFADKEELGMRGATTSTYNIAPDEAVAVDVSFGDTPGVPSHQTGKMGGGAMICHSPALTKSVIDGLFEVSKELSVQPEVTGGRTGTDIDVISISRGGVKSGLVSVPQRNMHTPAETVRTSDVKSVADVLINYAMNHKGGAAK